MSLAAEPVGGHEASDAGADDRDPLRHARERFAVDVREGDLVSADLHAGRFDAVVMGASSSTGPTRGRACPCAGALVAGRMVAPDFGDRVAVVAARI